MACWLAPWRATDSEKLKQTIARLAPREDLMLAVASRERLAPLSARAVAGRWRLSLLGMLVALAAAGCKTSAAFASSFQPIHGKHERASGARDVRSLGALLWPPREKLARSFVGSNQAANPSSHSMAARWRCSYHRERQVAHGAELSRRSSSIASPRSVKSRRLGFEPPARELYRYWVLGVPDPAHPAAEVLDDTTPHHPRAGRMANRLRQLHRLAGESLPSKVTLAARTCACASSSTAGAHERLAAPPN